ncbi:YodC family protein [Halosquirtibacter laminarini]|uniref:YodC family protein n=1 Tax=Halosquirtibacter laminarini TaxID=3374600 RepID=A0AC61NQ79_9BACT|nr:YodC family protein [Prolixibacteraceae bacterium]
MEESKEIKKLFKPGDVVTLKSGSVPMTVEVNYQSTPTMPVDVWCVYHINGTGYTRHQYRQEMLEKKY